MTRPRLADSVSDTVKATTFERYEQITRLHLKPALGRLKLKALTPAHVRGIYREKLEAGSSARTVRYIHTTLYKALKQAVMDGLILRNATAADPRRDAPTHAGAGQALASGGA
jgi:integrase